MGAGLWGEAGTDSRPGGGEWDEEVVLPDSYLPAGFYRDKSSDGYYIISSPSGDGAGGKESPYRINISAWISNRELSAEPGDKNCPIGSGHFKALRPLRVGEARGHWSVVSATASGLDANCVFKSGAVVAGIFLRAKATGWNGRAPTIPRPTEHEVFETLQKFVDAHARYIRDRGWMTAPRVPPSMAGANQGTPVQSPAPRPDVTADPPADVGRSPDAEIPVGVDNPTVPGASAIVGAGTLAAGAVTALGAGLMMLGMGVGPREVLEGAREWFGGGGQAAEAGDEMLPRQLAVAERIRREGWTDVSSQEQDLLRASPEWLREAVKRGLPAQAVDQYRWGTLRGEYLTCGAKVIQSGCDVAIGVLSTANPALGIHYTYWKNVLGSVSEGVADYSYGKNEKGLFRNAGEGLFRGTARAGVEIAVDAAAGHLMAGGAGRFAVDPNTISAGAFAAREAAEEVAGGYFAGQAGKYAVDAATGGYLGTTSPVEKATLDAVTRGISDLAGSLGRGGPVPPAPRLPHEAHNLTY